MIWGLSLLPTDLITRRLSPRITVVGIRSLIGVGTRVGALALSVLYLQHLLPQAIPKYLSERTSYHRP